MIVFLNGKFVAETHAAVPLFDRCLWYGDGVFETIRVSQGKPFRFDLHLARLQHGAETLGIDLPFSGPELLARAMQLIHKSELSEAVLRIILSRGVGERGYSPRGADRPWLAMSVHPLRPTRQGKRRRWRLISSSYRIPADAGLSRMKSCNKLLQVLARRESDSKRADDA